MTLNTPLTELGRTYKMYAKRLAKVGIFTVGDLLYYFPTRYENFTLHSSIDIAQPGETVTIQGTVVDVQRIFTRRFKVQKVTIQDETGVIDAIWFNQAFILRIIHKGDEVSIAGRVGLFGKKKSITVKSYEVLRSGGSLHTDGLVPVYSLTEGLSSKWIRSRIHELLSDSTLNLEEYIPQELLMKHDFLPLPDALQSIHYPDASQDSEKGRERFAFEELLVVQLGALLRRQEWHEGLSALPIHASQFKKDLGTFFDSLPFELTSSQANATQDIFSDMGKSKPMNRMLQGDVGSGKTIVAGAAAYLAFLSGYKTIFMAPTEILAQQHFKTLETLLAPFEVRVKLMTSSNKLAPKDLNTFDILVGTHAVLSKSVNQKNVALVIIDEQHRFGVEQRAQLREKGTSPHFLTMTATPIPRTVSLTVFGDLDLTTLTDMPKGRLRVKTWLVSEGKRKSAYEWIRKELESDRDAQVFVVCPFIEESESMETVKAATKVFEELSEVYPEFGVSLLHGKQKAKEKDEILHDFREKKFRILVATPIVEVGIDIPDATIMVIEGAERFGLAQLYQLRGRVGRSDKQSYCLLFSSSKNPKTLSRLKLLERAYSGAELSELDLKLRGPGDVFGTMQHGVKLLKVASFSDFQLIETARKEAEQLLPSLNKYPLLKEKAENAIISTIAPD